MKSEWKKKSLGGINSILDSVWEKREHDGREIDFIPNEMPCVKIVEVNEQNLIDLWENIKCYDMHGILGTEW